MNDLKFTTAGEYMTEQVDEKTQRPYYINEDGSRVDVITGELLTSTDIQAQCLAPQLNNYMLKRDPIVQQVRELLERHLDVLEIARRLHLDPQDVALVVEFIKQWMS